MLKTFEQNDKKTPFHFAALLKIKRRLDSQQEKSLTQLFRLLNGSVPRFIFLMQLKMDLDLFAFLWYNVVKWVKIGCLQFKIVLMRFLTVTAGPDLTHF